MIPDRFGKFYFCRKNHDFSVGGRIFFVRLFGSVPATGHRERRESRGGREGEGQEVGVREGEPEFAPTRAPARLGDSTTGPGAPSMGMLQPGPKGRRGRLRVEK